MPNIPLDQTESITKIICENHLVNDTIFVLLIAGGITLCGLGWVVHINKV